MVERDLSIYTQSMSGKRFYYQDYRGNEIDAVIELEDGNWCVFEIKLGLSKAEEGAKNLIKVCNDIVRNGGKEPKIKCAIYGVGNMEYQNNDGVYILLIWDHSFDTVLSRTNRLANQLSMVANRQ